MTKHYSLVPKNVVIFVGSNTINNNIYCGLTFLTEPHTLLKLIIDCHNFSGASEFDDFVSGVS